ncbi:MAG: L,D-transpeptidase Cds6 family protein [Burkholderiales bacterium]
MADTAGTLGQLKQRAPKPVRIAGAALAAALWTVSPLWAMSAKPIQRAAPAPDATAAPVEPEALLIKTLLAIKNNQLETALLEIEKVLQASPNFRLAHLIKGDLLLARSQPLKTMGDATGAPDRVADLREEARARLARSKHERPADRVPRYLVQLQSDQKYALVVDTSKSTLYVFENQAGTAKYLADYYISSGKNGIDKVREGDKKTPVGVYHVTSSMPREKLTDFYGTGAFPINYPNEWDRRQGRNGSGIWLHGTPSDTFSRPPQASDGCVVLTNRDLEVIRQRVQVGLTPVIISSGIEWVQPQAISGVRQELAGALEQWRRDWESLNTEKYLAHYSPTFRSGTQDYKAFAQQKRQVNAGKQWVKVKVDGLSMFLYPGKEKVAVVTFVQDYSSSNLQNRMRKRQYWIKEGSGWRIVHEGAA